jgi:transposase
VNKALAAGTGVQILAATVGSFTAVGYLLARLGLTPQKPLERAYQRDPEAIERWQREQYPRIAAQAKRAGAEILFWDESGFRADAVHSKTWGVRGQTPVVARPGQRQSIRAASAVAASGAFWYCTYPGALNAELFVELLRQLMRGRRQPVHLIVDGLPAHKKACVREYVAGTDGKLTLHLLPGYAPDLNPDELVWSHVKRTGVARAPLRAGESLRARIEQQLEKLKRTPSLIRSFFRAPSVAYIFDHQVNAKLLTYCASLLLATVYHPARLMAMAQTPNLEYLSISLGDQRWAHKETPPQLTPPQHFVYQLAPTQTHH